MALQEQSAPGKLLVSQNANWAPVVFVSARKTDDIQYIKKCVGCIDWFI